MSASAHPQPLNAALAFEATLVPSGSPSSKGGDGGIRPAIAATPVRPQSRPPYIEANSPANVTLYQRHGFEVRGHHANGVATTPRFDAGLDVTLRGFNPKT